MKHIMRRDVDTEYAIINKSLYLAQCTTFAIARELMGCGGPNGLATPGNHPLVTFRAYPKYRTATAKHLRRVVAQECRKLALDSTNE